MLPELPFPEPPISGQKKMVEKRKKKAAGKGKAGGGTLSSMLPGPAQLGNLAEMIERQGNAQMAQAEQKSGLTATDPFSLLQQQIMGQANSINVAATPYEQLKKLAQDQVGAQFDPMIALLNQQMTTHGKRAERSAKSARDMYNALGNDFLGQLPELTQQFAADDKETNSRYDNAQATLKQQYGDQQAQQNAVLQKLGIQAAAPDASKQANADQSYLQGQMEADQQSAMNAQNQQQTAQSNYMQNLGDSTKVAGANASSDIEQQLMDYLDQANTQMSGLQSQKGSALSSLLQQMQAQDAQRVQTQEQQQFQQLMSLANFQLDAAKASASSVDKNASSPFGDATSGIPGAENYLASQYPNSPVMASNLMEQLNDVLQNKNVVNGNFLQVPGDPNKGVAPKYTDVGQEYIMKLLRNELAHENQVVPGRYGDGDVASAIAAMQAYLGKVH